MNAAADLLFGHGWYLSLGLAGLATSKALLVAGPGAWRNLARIVVGVVLVAGLAGAMGASLPAIGPAVGLLGIWLGGLLVFAIERPLWLVAAPVLLLAAVLAHIIGVAAATDLRFAGSVMMIGVALMAGGALLGRLLHGAGDPALRLLGGWGAAAMLVLVVGLDLDGGKRPDLSQTALVGSRHVERVELDPDEIRDVLTSVLAGVYVAFEEGSEEGVYDALAAVARADLATELYLQERRALAIREDDARAQVLEVALDEVTAAPLTEGAGYRISAAWRVRGTVEHWGHAHERTNRYTAELRLVPADGLWKLASFELRDVQREVGEPGEVG